MRPFTARGETRRLDDQTRSAARGHYVACSAGVTHYELTGPDGGDLVLLVGGLTIPLYYWDALVEQLHGLGFRTLTCSGYGRGYSDRVTATYDEALFVRQLADLIAAIDVRPTHVMGSSMGALVAMGFALEFPGPLTSVTIIGPSGMQPRKPPFTALLKVPVLGVALGAAFGSRLLERHLKHNVRDPEQADELARMVKDGYTIERSIYALCATVTDFALTGRHELYRTMGSNGLPVLLLWGDDDEVTPISGLDSALELLRPTRVEVVRGCGHMVAYENPHFTADVFAEFVSSIQGAS